MDANQTRNNQKTTPHTKPAFTAQDIEDPASSDNTTTSKAKSPVYSPNVTGEQSVSGNMPDPESDDDVLKNAHDVGLALGEDEEHPKPLDIGKDVNKAEKFHRENS